MLLLSMGVSVDGFVCNRDEDFSWGAPDDELFSFHTERISTLGACILGRKLYEMMLVWENDPEFRKTELDKRFAELWTALPKVVFSRTLTSVQGNARLATGSVAEEVAATLASTGKDVEIGGPTLAGQAIELGLVDEFAIFRYPVIVGGGTPLLPPVAKDVPLDLVETRTFSSRIIYERYRRAAAE
ncbi:MAG TPA: dihydrofolate reductase family protein [Baekduia sp.]|nr:dihydrofolate reductase family protein [Baekduia sp.]